MRTFGIVVHDSDGGIGATEIAAYVSDASVEIQGDAGLTRVSANEDNTSVEMLYIIGDTNETGPVSIAEVTMMDESGGAVEVSVGSIEGTDGIRLFDGAGERYGEIESNSVTATVGPSNDGGTDDGSETDPSTAGSGGGDVDASSSDTSSDSDSDGTDGRDTVEESPPTHVGTTRGQMLRTPPLTIAPARVKRPIVRRTSVVNRHRTQPLRGPKWQN